MVFALAIAACLQLFDRRACQDLRVGTDEVIDIGTDGAQRVDTDEVGRSQCEAFVPRVTVDEERAVTEFELAELASERLGLRVLELERLDDDELAAIRLVAQGHLQAEGADLLVQRVAHGAGTRAMRLYPTDEGRRPAIPVTSRNAAPLHTELLAGPRHTAPFRGATPPPT